MNDDVNRFVNALREDAEWAHANEWETPITLGDHLEEAANRIERLAKYVDAWQRRAEAAERDIETLLMEGCAGCDFCAKFETCSDEDTEGTYCKSKWRGPCAENGGEPNAPD